METKHDIPEPRQVVLSAGAQVVINGAVVTAHEPCRIEVGSGAFVLTGCSPLREQGQLHHPREELYFSMLEAAANEDSFVTARFRLFRLLSQVVAQEQTHEGQKECAACAAAMMAGDVRAAVASAARLASARLSADTG